jgi:hypothetical protein
MGVQCVESGEGERDQGDEGILHANQWRGRGMVLIRGCISVGAVGGDLRGACRAL